MVTVKQKITLQLEVLQKQLLEVAEEIEKQQDRGVAPQQLIRRRDYLHAEINSTQKLLEGMADATA